MIILRSRNSFNLKRRSKPNKARSECRKADKAWSDEVRQKDGFRCQWCIYRGIPAQPNNHNHAHHIVSRAVCGKKGRHDPENGMTLCFHDHYFRLKQDVDGYIKFRDEWLKSRGLTYEDLKRKYEGNYDKI